MPAADPQCSDNDDDRTYGGTEVRSRRVTPGHLLQSLGSSRKRSTVQGVRGILRVETARFGESCGGDELSRRAAIGAVKGSVPRADRDWVSSMTQITITGACKRRPPVGGATPSALHCNRPRADARI